MKSKQEIVTQLNEVWLKLSERWTGEDSNAFYQQYIAKMIEVSEDFEEACYDLETGAADLAKKLAIIEHDIA